MKVKINKKEVLEDSWYQVSRTSFDFQKPDGEWEAQERISYHKGNAAVILLYNKENQTVVLTRQFRLPTYMNGNEDGMMIEACAGLLDDDSPEDCIKKETEEETGYRIKSVQKIFETYMLPGTVTEMLHFFVAKYDSSMKINDGGGLADEQEYIEVLEIPFEEAVNMMRTGEIKDAKTVMLLQYAQIHKLL